MSNQDEMAARLKELDSRAKRIAELEGEVRDAKLNWDKAVAGALKVNAENERLLGQIKHFRSDISLAEQYDYDEPCRKRLSQRSAALAPRKKFCGHGGWGPACAKCLAPEGE